VAGDALDLIGLAKAFRESGAKRSALAFATTAVLVIMVLDFATAAEASRRDR